MVAVEKGTFFHRIYIQDTISLVFEKETIYIIKTHGGNVKTDHSAVILNAVQ